MRRPPPLSPAWFAHQLLAVAVGLALLVGLDALAPGTDALSWPVVGAFLVVMVGVAVVDARGRREPDAGRPG